MTTIDAKVTLEREILSIADQIKQAEGRLPGPDHQAAIYHRNTLLSALAIVNAIDNVAGAMAGLDARLGQIVGS